MKKKKINKLYINFAYISLVLSTTTFAIAGYTLLDNSSNIEKIEFESTCDNDICYKKQEIYIRTHDVDDYDKEENNNYSGMKLSHEYEDYIKDLCIKYSKEYEIDCDQLFHNVLVIGDQESNGEWNNNGVISETNDYGEFQINIVNHELIKEELGYTTDELLNDSNKNAEAAVWMISNIMINEHCKTDADIYGMYNGWINWSDKEGSIKYVDSCLARNDTYFVSNVVNKK